MLFEVVCQFACFSNEIFPVFFLHFYCLRSFSHLYI